MHGLVLPDPGEPLYCARCAEPLVASAEGGQVRPQCPSCGWTYYAKPALGAGVLIEDGGRLLLVRRAHEPYRGWWMLPGGFVEYGEDAAETAAREALEETGLLVEITGYHGIFFGGGDPRGAGHLAVFHAHPVGGTLAPGDDASEAVWFDASHIPEEIAFEGNRKAIARWLASQWPSPGGPTLLLYAGTGPAPPLIVYVVIENPEGSVDRVIYDAQRHEFLCTGEVFPEPLPVHYGWIPRTLTEADNRELDAVVVAEGSVAVGSVVAMRPLGALLREDGDHKVVGVRVDLPSAYVQVTELAQLPAIREMVEALFRPRARLLGWASAPEARKLVLDSQRAWIGRHRAEC